MGLDFSKYKVYSNTDLEKIAAASGNTSGCCCKERPIWPIPENPPTPPNVIPRPYPPEFPPPLGIFLTSNAENTELTVNNPCCCERKPLYAYISSAVSGDIAATSGVLEEHILSSLISAQIYTDEAIATLSSFYGQTIRFRGYASEPLNNLVSSLYIDARGNEELALDIIKNEHGITEFKKYSVLDDLRLCDLYICSSSIEISGKTYVSTDEYICLSATPILSAKFEKFGNNNIKDIEYILNTINQRITDEKNDLLSTISTVSGACNDYTDEQCAITLSTANHYTDTEIAKLGTVFNVKGYANPADPTMVPTAYIRTIPTPSAFIEQLRKGDVYLAKTGDTEGTLISEFLYLGINTFDSAMNNANWEKFGNHNGYALSTDVDALVAATSTYLKEYTDTTAEAAKNAAILSSNTYTDKEISTLEVKAALSAVAAQENAIVSSKTYTDFVSAAFAGILTGKLIDALTGTFIYKNYACITHPEIVPWEVEEKCHIVLSDIKQGYTYKVHTPFYGTLDDGTSAIAGYEDIQYTFIGTTSAQVNDKNAYLKLGSTTDLSKYSTVGYVDNQVSSARIDLSAYVELASGNINTRIDTEVETLNNSITSARTDLSAYVELASGNINTRINNEVETLNNSITSARTDLSAYTDKVGAETLISAKTYANEVSAGFASSLISGLIGNLSGTLIDKGYACTQHPTVAPWLCVPGKHDVIITDIKKGYTYLVSTAISGSDEFGQPTITGWENVQYMFNSDLSTDVGKESAYIKLGYTTDLSKYSTVDYVNNQVTAARTDLSAYTDKVGADTLASAKAYTDIVSGNINTRIDTEVETLNNSIASARTDLSAYADKVGADTLASGKAYTVEVSGNINTRIDTEIETLNTTITTEIISTRTDLSAYTDKVGEETLTSAKVYANSVSAGFASALISGLIGNLSGTLIDKGYACTQHPTVAPWICVPGKHDVVITDIKKGYTYLVSTAVSGTDNNGNTVLIGWENVQYMFNSDLSTDVGYPSAYVKLGFTTDLSKYSTVGYVNNQISATRTDLSAYTDKVGADTLASAKAYTDIVSGALSTIIDVRDGETLTSAKAYTDIVSSALSTIIDVRDGETLTSAKAYTDAVSGDLSGMIDTRDGETLTSAKAYTDIVSGALSTTIDVRDGETLTSAKAYTDIVSGALSGMIDTRDSETYISAKNYTDTRVNAIGTIFTFRGYADPINTYAYPWDVANLTVSGGYVYLTDINIDDPEKPGSTYLDTVEHVYISGEYRTSASWQLLGKINKLTGYATVNYVDGNIQVTSTAITSEYTALIDVTSGKTLDLATVYTNEVSGSLSSMIDIRDGETLTNAKAYTDIVSGALSTAIDTRDGETLTNAKAYTDIVSGALSTAIDTRDGETLTSAKAYTDIVSGNLSSMIDIRDSETLTSAKAYTDEKVAGLGNVFEFKGYATEDHKTAPWNATITPKKGDVYLVDVTVEDPIQHDDTLEYVFVDTDKTGANIETNYQQLGRKTSLSGYATTNYVNGQIQIVSANITDVYNETKAASSILNGSITDLTTTVTTLSSKVDTHYTETQSVSSTLNGLVNKLSGEVGITSAAAINIASSYAKSIDDQLRNRIDAVDNPLTGTLQSVSSNLQGQINTINGTISTHDTNISTLSSKVNINENNISKLTNNINELSANTVGIIDTRIQAASAASVTEATNNAKSYTDIVSSALSTAAKGYTDTVVGHKDAGIAEDNVYGRLNAVSAAVKANSEKITINIQNITNNTTDIATLNNQYTTLDSRIDTLESQATGITTNRNNIQAISTEIGKITDEAGYTSIYAVIKAASGTAKAEAKDYTDSQITSLDIPTINNKITYISGVIGDKQQAAGVDSIFGNIKTIENNISTVSAKVDQNTADIAQALTDAKAYTDEVSSALSSAAKTYSDSLVAPINTKLDGIDTTVTAYVSSAVAKLGTVFNYKGYAGPADAAGHHTAYPWEITTIYTTAIKGDVYLTDVSSEITGATSIEVVWNVAEFAFTGDDASIKEHWQQLGTITTQAGFATKGYVDAQDKLLDNKIESVSGIASGDVSRLAERVTANENKLVGIDTAYFHVTTVTGYIDSTIAPINQNISTISSNLGIVKNQLSGFADNEDIKKYVDQKVQFVQDQIDTLSTTVTNLSTTLGDLSGSMNEFEADLTAILIKLNIN